MPPEAWKETPRTEAELGKNLVLILAAETMTAFAPANLPASVNTVEKLAAWANGVLYQLHKSTKYQESDGSPLVPVITAQDGLAADKTERIIYRASLPLSDNWREQTTKYWQEVQEISNAAIPTSFLS